MKSRTHEPSGVWIIRAQQGEGGTETERGVGRERQQMGLGMMRLADLAASESAPAALK